MELREKIREEMKKAMKAHRGLEVSVLRMLVSALQNKEIEKRAKVKDGVLDEAEVLGVIRSEAKKRKDAAEEFTKGGRTDLATKESGELLILQAYLPHELSDEEIKEVVAGSIKKIGGATAKDFGRIMADAMKRVEGRAAGDRVGDAVREILT